MTPEWLVARFVPDLRRGEQKNIGIVLFHGGKVYARFLGEGEPEEIDGRKLKAIRAYHENYKRWIHYWRAVASVESIPKLLARRPDDNYFLERSGRIIAGNDEDPQALLQQVYSEIVARPATDEPVEQTDDIDEVEQVFDTIGSRFELEREVLIDVDSDTLSFEYRVRASKFLFRKCLLNSNPKRTWASVHDTVHSVNAAAGGGYTPYAVVFEHDSGSDVVRQRITLTTRLDSNRILDLAHGVMATADHISHLIDGKTPLPV